jgi:UDP:flavonoid glycosyltransferase YjiC (YdhE family)
MLAALAHGIPQLCLPQAADQFDNAEICAGAGAAIALEGPAVTAESVRGALARLLDGDEVRTEAGRLAREIAALPPPEQAAGELLGTFS